MYFSSSLDKFVALEGQTLKQVLAKINNNKSGAVIVIDPEGRVKGTLTDGDIRRTIVDGHLTDKLVFYNKDFQYVYLDDFEQGKYRFTDRIKFLPVITRSGYLKSIIFKDKKQSVQIDGKFIGKSYPTYIIAEIGNNHNGSVKLGEEMIMAAKEVGADAVKFQFRVLNEVYHNTVLNGASDLGTEYTLDLLRKYNLSQDSLFHLLDYAKQVGITAFVTPWDVQGLKILNNYGVPAYKIASADLTNLPFVREVLKTGVPTILSTGMSRADEIRKIVELSQNLLSPTIFLHCNSTYPAPYDEINLPFMSELAEMTKGEVGYSGHEIGWHIPLAAVAMGASVIEKHFTFDKAMEGVDHKVSLLPEEFSKMVAQIRQLESSLHSNRGSRAEIGQGELINRENLSKSVYVKSDVQVGDELAWEDVEVRSPGGGLTPLQFQEFIGVKLIKYAPRGQRLYENHFVINEHSKIKPYKFPIKWGVPVRFHDVASLSTIFSPEVLEYHLSYSDLSFDKFDQLKCLSKVKKVVVHAPELFEGDHLLDLASFDQARRKSSIQNMLRVIEISKLIKDAHKLAEPVDIITNVGGFSANGFCDTKTKKQMYKLVEDALTILDCPETNVIIQTMPPFPWHFGGQSFHNLFVKGDEIVEFCKENKRHICLDTSHSYLASNYHKFDFYKFIEEIIPFTNHLHIVDAKGHNDEGLNIGDGLIDFSKIFELTRSRNNMSFIPEIWQGHRDDGLGFKLALNRLSELV